MAVLTWANATHSLLSYLQIANTDCGIRESKEILVNRLLGSEFSVRALRSRKNILDKSGAAALLKTSGGKWIPVFIKESCAYQLTENAQIGEPLSQEVLSKVLDGYSLVRVEPTSNHIFSFYRHHKKQVLQVFSCGLFINFFGLSLPIFSCFVYDKILGNGITDTLWALAIGLFLLSILDFSLRALRILVAERFAVSSEADIDRQVLRSLLSAHAQNLPSIGQFLDRYRRLSSARDLLSSTYLLSLVDLPFLALFALAIFCTAPALVLVPLVFGFLMLAIALLTSVPIFEYDKKSKVPNEDKFKLLTGLISAHEVVVGTGLYQKFMKKWQESCVQASSAQSLSRYWRGISASFSSISSFLSYVCVIIGGVYMIEDQSLSSGGLLAVSMLSSRMMASFSSVVIVITRFRDFRLALNEMNEILPTTEVDPYQQVIPRELKGNIIFDKVTCRLREKALPVFSNVDMRINHGEMIGVVGIPGSGKTTFLRLIAGVIEPESGSVSIDHFPTLSLTQEERSNTVGYKPQDLCLLEGTIEENICAGGKALSPHERTSLLKQSGLGWSFQQGGIDWTTEVGSQGRFLSGGQRQLVALARALHRNKSILLFDEPTNGLDAQIEKHFVQQLAQMRGSATIVISAHSSHLLSICDRIVVVGDGKILADGPREKVLAA